VVFWVVASCSLPDDYNCVTSNPIKTSVICYIRNICGIKLEKL
jgi:hypothetical protein